MSINRKGTLISLFVYCLFQSGIQHVRRKGLCYFEHITHNNIKILMQMATHDKMSTHFYLSHQGWHTFFSLLKQSGISWSFRCFLRFSEYLAFVMVYLEQISHTIRPAESITKHQHKLRYDFHL